MSEFMEEIKRARSALHIAKAVGYNVDDELKALDEAEAAEQAQREAEDAELQAQRERDAMDDEDERNGNSRGMTRAILAERARRKEKRDFRKTSPEVQAAFEEYDRAKESEREADQRKRSPMPKGYEELTAFEVDKQRQQKAQQRRDDFYANRDKRRNDFTEFLNAERERRR